MTRIPAVIVLLVVTTLLAAYGAHAWSWVGGPVAALAIWALDRKAHEPAEAPARLGEPAPVD
jgi:predicted membrane-bound dolichyl-phosphate-mannose-protein mannosyltransferase